MRKVRGTVYFMNNDELKELQFAEKYLKSRGVNQKFLDRLRVLYMLRGTDDSQMYQFDRFLAITAYILHKNFGFGHKRLMNAMQSMVDLIDSMANGDTTPEEIMQKVAEETGIIVKMTDNELKVGITSEYSEKEE